MNVFKNAIVLLTVVFAILILNFVSPAIAAQGSSQSNKDIALRFAQEGWGTNSGSDCLSNLFREFGLPCHQVYCC